MQRRFMAVFLALGVSLTFLLGGQGCTRTAASLDKKEERNPLMRRAKLKEKAGETDHAIALYQKALDRNPDMARAHLNLGLLYDKNKEDFVRAIYHYQRYIELRPEAEKRKMIEGLIRYAEMSFAAAQAEKPSTALETITALKTEVSRLKQELVTARAQASVSRAHTTPSSSPASRAKPAGRSQSAPEKPRDAVTTADIPAPSSSRSSIPLAPPAAPAMQAYKVQKGDTLSEIAKKMYNDSSKWRIIYDANRNVLSSPESLQLNQTLIIPQL